MRNMLYIEKDNPDRHVGKKSKVHPWHGVLMLHLPISLMAQEISNPREKKGSRQHKEENPRRAFETFLYFSCLMANKISSRVISVDIHETCYLQMRSQLKTDYILF